MRGKETKNYENILLKHNFIAFLHTNMQGAIAVRTSMYAAFKSILRPVGPPGIYVDKYQRRHANCTPAESKIRRYLFMKTVMKKVDSIVTARQTNGSDFSNPADVRPARKTDGVCMTITDEAAKQVLRVMHITNFAGRKTMVGSPTNTAKKANTKEATIR